MHGGVVEINPDTEEYTIKNFAFEGPSCYEDNEIDALMWFRDTLNKIIARKLKDSGFEKIKGKEDLKVLFELEQALSDLKKCSKN
jgi:hypothetical protein